MNVFYILPYFQENPIVFYSQRINQQNVLICQSKTASLNLIGQLQNRFSTNNTESQPVTGSKF